MKGNFFKQKSNPQNDLGFGTNNYSGTRFFKPDGSVNIRRRGKNFLESIDLYHALLTMKRGKFIFVVILSYFVTNFLFASVYYLIGTENFGNLRSDQGEWAKLLDLAFFSAQTLTTVGYGYIYPSSPGANFIAALESMTGLLSFAVATGVLYGRFSRPVSPLIYSKNMVLAPYKGGTALMFRVVNPKQNELIEAEAEINLSLKNPEGGPRQFYSLSLERKRISFLALNWTIVHPLDETSPIGNYSVEGLKKLDAEFLIMIKAINDSFSNLVYSRTSYKAEDIIPGAKFTSMFGQKSEGGQIFVDVSKINQYEEVPLPEVMPRPETVQVP